MDERLQRVKIRLVSKYPWLAYTILNTEIRESKCCPTMSTNGYEIYYNEDFVKGLTDKQLTGVMLHEYLHILFGHMERLRDRIPTVWNLATDVVVNYFVENEGFDLPEGHLNAQSIGYQGDMVSEKVYDFLRKQFKDDSQSKDSFNRWEKRRFDKHESTPNDKQGKSRECMTAAKLRGDIPAGILREWEATEEGKIDWRKLLTNLVSRNKISDYTWLYPNSRYYHAGVYLPSVMRENIDNVCVLVDTSGSIGKKELSMFMSELKNLCRKLQTTVKVVTSDADVHDVFDYDGTKKVKLHGGGGTDFTKAFELIKNRIKPACLVVFTDGCFDVKCDPPKFEVFWILTTREFPKNVKFGKKVYME